VVNKAEAAFIPVLRMVLLARVTIIHFRNLTKPRRPK
jgi:general stress protein CsbA